MPRLFYLACVGCLLAVGGWASDETSKPPREGGGAAARPNRPPGAAAGHKLNNPLNPGQQFLQMTPEEQERVMERANPQQQERMRAALEHYRSLPPAARDRLFRQYQLLKGLPVQQQAMISRQFQAFNQLPEERRWVVGQELLRLHRMPAEERAARLASEPFAARYVSGERQILSDLSLNLPAGYPLGGKPGN
jgi:hypothetical protein